MNRYTAKKCALVLVMTLMMPLMTGCTFLDSMASMYIIYAMDQYTRTRRVPDGGYAKAMEELRKMHEENDRWDRERQSRKVIADTQPPSSSSSEQNGSVPVQNPDSE